jgi:hypothetical protein
VEAHSLVPSVLAPPLHSAAAGGPPAWQPRCHHPVVDGSDAFFRESAQLALRGRLAELRGGQPVVRQGAQRRALVSQRGGERVRQRGAVRVHVHVVEP